MTRGAETLVFKLGRVIAGLDSCPLVYLSSRRSERIKMNKTIAFEKWLINNYPEREDNPDYDCVECEGDGILLGKDCFSCCGTGSTMHDEYEKQCEIDQELLRKFLS